MLQFNKLKHLFLRMKIGMAWHLPILFLLATAVAVRADDYTYYTNSHDTITISSYIGPGGDVVIPSVINGRAVTVIGSSAFYRRNNVTSVIIPDSVTIIGYHAFDMPGWFGGSDSSLTNVTLGTGVTLIGDYAFQSCYKLTSVTIPDSVTSIGLWAFAGCTGLTNVTIGTGLTSIGNGAFIGCDSLTAVTIPDSVTSIGDEAFASCDSLTAITVDAGNSAYSSVNGVLFDKKQTMLITHPAGKAGSYTIPESATRIEFHAFEDSTSLTSIIIGSGLTSIGDGAFIRCDNLTGVYFAGNAPSIGKYVFSGDDLATVYYLPGSTGWGWTFGGRSAMPWWDGPQISANGAREDVSLNRGEPVRISVATEVNDLAARPLDWWIIAWANDKLFYLNNSKQWTQFDGRFSNCHPVYQGRLFNLPAMEVLNTTDLPVGSYTFWFAIDYPMDGILNLGGYILIDSVNVIVQ